MNLSPVRLLLLPYCEHPLWSWFCENQNELGIGEQEVISSVYFLRKYKTL